MRIIWNITEECFQAEFDPGPAWKSDLAAAKSAGFVTDAAPDWLWCTSSVFVLNKLRENRPISGLTITQEALQKYQEMSEAEKAAIEDSKATEVSLDIPTPNGLSFLPYQKAGILRALKIFGDL